MYRLDSRGLTEGETDAEGELIERPTTRHEAYRFFEQEMALRA